MAATTRARIVTREEEMTMKRLMLVLMVVVLATSLAGCNSCRRRMGGLFNRGDRCEECPPMDYGPGGPQSTLMVPGSTPVMTGPIEIAPAG
jgi:hypothetical protein